jgi:hypothetical protein
MLSHVGEHIMLEFYTPYATICRMHKIARPSKKNLGGGLGVIQMYM